MCPECAIKLNWKREKEFRRAQSQRLQAAVAARAGDKRGRPGASDYFGGGGRGGKEARIGGGFDEPEQGKQWVAPPPGAPPAAAGGSVQGGEVGGAGAGGQQVCVMPGDDSVWEAKPAAVQEATAEEEFEAYFDGMFL